MDAVKERSGLLWRLLEYRVMFQQLHTLKDLILQVSSTCCPGCRSCAEPPRMCPCGQQCMWLWHWLLGGHGQVGLELNSA
ncbi:hypothetical protein AV530_015130 [Patagioenas fasciata monilis]|uniref:Uncharacterized protein n=1 Tax=Patagioenas fasciata monilis TaxID=372326 RepID=A0A1V4K1B3_PATFA|nr:hypothetical protein AV530_015130 [Patagioenas fasciata monilis]